MNNDIQYISNVKKGDSVTFGNGSYRVQDDKGWLHIVVKENGIRRKYGVDDLLPKYGSEADYIFNGWWNVYPDYNVFRGYALSELAWIKL